MINTKMFVASIPSYILSFSFGNTNLPSVGANGGFSPIPSVLVGSLVMPNASFPFG